MSYRTLSGVKALDSCNLKGKLMGNHWVEVLVTDDTVDRRLFFLYLNLVVSSEPVRFCLLL